MWLQWCLDEQLAGRAAHRAVGGNADRRHPRPGRRRAPRRRGHLGARRRRWLADVTVGAPPDAFNQQGQDWSQPPWRPTGWPSSGYAPYRDMLRTVLRHAGGLRVDHVIGLFRLWWVPRGLQPRRGHVRDATTTRRWSGSSRSRRTAAGAVRRRRGPRHGRAVGPRLPARARHPRHVDPVVRARRRRPAAAAGAVARALPGHRDDARPAADRRLPGAASTSSCASVSAC